MRTMRGSGRPGDLLPQLERLVVVDIDGRDQPVLGQAEFPGDEVPGELDRAVLEVVAERKIAEHLEEGVVARGVADVVEVVVLAAGAHAFLRGDRALVGALLDAGEHVLELHHAGVGEHQGRVVARHERRRRHDLVAGLREIVEEALPDVVDAAHVPAVPGPTAAKRRARLMFPGDYVATGWMASPGTAVQASLPAAHVMPWSATRPLCPDARHAACIEPRRTLHSRTAVDVTPRPGRGCGGAVHRGNDRRDRAPGEPAAREITELRNEHGRRSAATP